ncbi:hypothetical protein, conserved [Leishmania tarentolae]|uniref:Uncharacterized protein n=1 Tax=Leishmania tarentolae TaxID=5689 RepID=A0A640KGX0_LEITA|nr:hypothetical protein, conserved [Leishmania tarentolae]
MANVKSPGTPFNAQQDNESKPASAMLRPAPAMAASKGSIPFVVVDGNDPLALLYSTPANQPLSLAKRTHGSESLFQYYALRGYKEVLSEEATPEAAKAVQACLEGGDEIDAGGCVAATAVQHRLSDKKSGSSLNTHIIDRCLVSTAAAAASPDGSTVALSTGSAINNVVPHYVPLRPAQTQDVTSSFRIQRTDERRAAAEQERRQRLRLVPEAAVYHGRYYPEDSHIVADALLPLTEGKSDFLESLRAAAYHGARNPAVTSVPPSVIPAPPGSSRTLSPGLGCNSTVKTTDSLSLQSIAPLLLRTPQEVTTTMQMQQESRHALADQIENAFVGAYNFRDPAAAQRQRDRESMEALRASTQAAAALLVETGAASAMKRRATAGASKKVRGKKKKSPAGPVAPPKREGGVPTNLEVFRTSLLLVCNEDGAVTLEQLRVVLANVPFHVGTLTETSESACAGVAQQLFHLLHKATRAPRASDATDLLLAVASATPAGGGSALLRSGNVPGDSFVYTTSHSVGNSLSRASVTPTAARRGPGANRLPSAVGKTRQPSTFSMLQGSNTSVTTAVTGAADIGGGTSSEAHTPRTPSLTTGAASLSNEGVAAGSGGRQQPHHSVPADLHDECACVLVVEVLDALDALLNSVETKRIVRWECFNVLAVEGNGYIHKSQLAKLRRCAYRDGSAAEEQAAVTAAMVKALSDAFTVVATEEEAAYLKANKKRKKKKGAAIAVAAHQSSPIPLSVMRKSHMDYTIFCRLFDEIPLMAAAFAHVWLPLLLQGHRHTAAAGSTMARLSDVSKGSIASPLPDSAARATSLMASSRKTSVSAVDEEEATSDRFPSSVRPRWRAASATEDDPNASPLELLGSTVDTRQAAVKQLVMGRQEQLHQACDAAEKEKLTAVQSNEAERGSVFANS